MTAMLWLAALAMVSTVSGASPAPSKLISSIDLAKAFHTRSAWTFTATQGPDIADPTGDEGQVAGAITLCLSRDAGKTCDHVLTDAFAKANDDDLFTEPHSLVQVEIDHLPGSDARPLFFLKTASVLSTDGNARVVTQILLYDRAHDAFTLAWQHSSGHNNSEALRYVPDGPLAGDVITAEPTQDKPYGFWVTVNKLSAKGVFEQVLNYRSATRYGDGNPLSVIDSELPNIEQHLGLWHPGQPLPKPAVPCAKPHLVKGALWCE